MNIYLQTLLKGIPWLYPIGAEDRQKAAQACRKLFQDWKITETDLATEELRSAKAPALLPAIFPTLSLPRSGSAKKVPAKSDSSPYFYQSLPLQILPSDFPFEEGEWDSDLFASSSPPDQEIQEQWRLQNWNAFLQEAQGLLESPDQESLGYNLYHLLFKYGARVPGANPQVSAFDQVRVEAALALCDSLHESDKQEYLLLKGDLSGIQKFIYSDIDMGEPGNTEKLAQKLRGRSFYVALLTDFLANLYVQQLGLTEANILYSGGGHFLLLMPSGGTTISKTQELAQAINMDLIDTIGFRTSFLIGMTTCEGDIKTDFSRYIRQVNDNLNEQKYRKHERYLEKIFFEPDHQLVLDSFKDDIYLGKGLPYAQYLVALEVDTVIAWEDKIWTPHASFLWQQSGTTQYFFLIGKDRNLSSQEQILKLVQLAGPRVKKVNITRLNSTDFLGMQQWLAKEQPTLPVEYGFRFVGSYAPLDEKKRTVLHFGELAEKNSIEPLLVQRRADLVAQHNLAAEANLSPPQAVAPTKLPYPMLGVLRLDVDDLGSIFAFGLGEDRSIGRVANLSRELSLFFSGYFNYLAKRFDVYTTYSGGDDAFVVGSWINVVHFAEALRKAFARFVCYNPDISFSGGIYFCSEHFPIAKFADKAEDCEKEAKAYAFDGQEKNAISVFNQTLDWESFTSMVDLAVKLECYTRDNEVSATQQKGGQISRSLVHRTLWLIKDSLAWGRNGIDGERMAQNRARLHYLFARQGFTEAEVKAKTKAITKDIMSAFITNLTQKRLLRHYQVAFQYVLLKTRKSSNS